MGTCTVESSGLLRDDVQNIMWLLEMNAVLVVWCGLHVMRYAAGKSQFRRLVCSFSACGQPRLLAASATDHRNETLPFPAPSGSDLPGGSFLTALHVVHS